MIADRQARGIAKYGITLADNPLSLREWLQHLLEEQLDAAAYTLRAIEEIDKPSNRIADKETDKRGLIDALEFRREQYGLRGYEWASLLGMAQSHYSEFKRGKRTLPKEAMAKAFAYGVPAHILFQEIPNKGMDDVRAHLETMKNIDKTR